MGRIYYVEFENVAVTASQDFFEILPATQKPCAVWSIELSQSSDAGDSEEELLRVKVIRGHTTSGSGGTTFTPTKALNSSTNAGFTAEVNNTTIASAGTGADLWSGTFNVRVGLEKVWLPETRPVVANANLLVVRLMAAPADSLTMSGTLTVEELA